MSEEDLDTEGQKKLARARARAEMRYEQEVENAQKQFEQQQKQREQQIEEATEFVTEEISAEDFGATSVEDRHRLAEFVQEDFTDGYNRAEVAVLVHSRFGEEVARRYIDGLRSEFSGEQTQEVTREIEESKSDPKEPAKPASEEEDDEPVERNYHNTLMQGLS
jgi:hypothetical protein